ncbi:hypothetical protein ISR94_02740 [Candidatus Microgenomates bacterium]|nr:hypothetical protein [Candidatus Microgenomates bacterium]
MKFFTRKDTKAIAWIFVVLIIFIGINLKVSIRRGRDNVRKSDLGGLQGALESYQQKYHVFPESKNGKIVGCFSKDTYYDQDLERHLNLVECEWGEDKFENLERLPIDPSHEDGRSYLYLSNIKHFQVFTSLEGRGEAEYTESIVERGLSCGESICNFGKNYGDIPLNVTLPDNEQN